MALIDLVRVASALERIARAAEAIAHIDPPSAKPAEKPSGGSIGYYSAEDTARRELRDELRRRGYKVDEMDWGSLQDSDLRDIMERL